MFTVDNPTYSDMVLNLNELREEISTLDDDSLIDEINDVQYLIVGKESDKIQNLIYKNNQGIQFTMPEREFLENVYLTYYSVYCISIDEEDEEILE
jgi:hypothetical protein